jgi:Tol biopolymer transport system component
LVFLVENRSRAVPKEEIMTAIWADTFVSDNALTRAIGLIRKALNDDVKEPRYIETVPTVGYRFVGNCNDVQDSPLTPAPSTKPRPVRLWLTGRWQIAGAASFGLAILALGLAWWMRAPRDASVSAAPRIGSFAQLTDQPGEELHPSLAPDGSSFVYTSRASGNWDIYSQRVGGKNPVNLTPDSTADDTQPVFSPDGKQIAFHSDRDGGGIFVMGASGENVKRITDSCYDPAWSPDGSQIVCATTLATPTLRLASQSQIFLANVTTGERRALTPLASNAVQPNWSPHGYRIAYWAEIQGRLNIWTIPAGGGGPVAVTNDAPIDWNPVWSPDGSYLYFASDRGGSMNLWRLPIDERSGKVLGEIQPVTTPSVYAASISFSRTGGEMVYAQSTQTSNIYRVRFDPERETAIGQPEPVTQGTRDAGSGQPSPDGEWVVFSDSLLKNNIFLVRSDGSGLRQVTDDSYRNRWPAWSPDGKQLAFFSNRGGNFDVWVVRPDGGGLHQLTHTQHGSLTHPVWSPDGKRMIYSMMNETPLVIEPDKPWNSQSPQALPPLTEPGTWFEVANWSPDGKKVAGFQLRDDGKFTGIGIYSFETRKYERITDFGFEPNWLNNGRSLVFTGNRPPDPQIYLVNIASRKVHPVLSVAPNGAISAHISADNRWIYFSLVVNEADVWLANLK